MKTKFFIFLLSIFFHQTSLSLTANDFLIGVLPNNPDFGYLGFKQSTTGELCKIKQKSKNKIIFLDEESPWVSRFPGKSMPPIDLLHNNPESYKTKVFEHSEFLKTNCLDVNLAPILEYMKDRSPEEPYLPTYVQIFEEASKKANLLTARKHYPGCTNKSTEINAVTTSEKKWIKRTDGDVIYINRVTEEQLNECIDLFKTDKPTIVMVSNSIYEASSRKPAIFDEKILATIKKTMPNAIVISDDLSNLFFSQDDVETAFKYVDLFITTEWKGNRTLEVFLTNIIQSSQSSLELCKKKQKINAFFKTTTQDQDCKLTKSHQ